MFELDIDVRFPKQLWWEITQLADVYRLNYFTLQSKWNEMTFAVQFSEDAQQRISDFIDDVNEIKSKINYQSY